MTTAMNGHWTCLEPDCGESGTGTLAQVSRAAEKHTKAGHATVAGTTEMPKVRETPQEPICATCGTRRGVSAPDDSPSPQNGAQAFRPLPEERR